MTSGIILYIILAYLVGAIPFGYLAGKRKGLDLRQEGSRNIGATNAWRVMGWRWGLPVFILDFLKGFIPVTLISTFFSFSDGTSLWLEPVITVLVSFAVVLGHTYTCYLGFKGGKGVATTAGVLFALNVTIAGMALVTWGLAMALTGIVSLASILAAVIMIILGWYIYPLIGEGESLSPDSLYIAFFTLIGLLVILRHRSNIVRLLRGEEHSFYSKKKK